MSEEKIGKRPRTGEKEPSISTREEALHNLKSKLSALDCSGELDFAESDGVTLNLLNKLTSEFGGRAALQGLTINQVRDKFIVPTRAASDGSYIDYLRGRPEFVGEVRPANVFTSYNLGCIFLDFVDAINRCYEHNPEKSSIVLFITVFSNNFSKWKRQHGGSQFPPASVMLGHVVMLSASIPRVLLVLCQWEDSGKTPLNRLWCLLELCVAAQLNHEVNIATCTKRSHFVGNRFDYNRDLVDSFLHSIEIQNAHTFSPDYDAIIYKFILLCGGFEVCNEHIRRMIQSFDRLPTLIRQKSLDASRLSFLVVDLDSLLLNRSDFTLQMQQCNMLFLINNLIDTSVQSVAALLLEFEKSAALLAGGPVAQATLEAEFLPHLIFADIGCRSGRFESTTSVASYFAHCDRHLNLSVLMSDPELARFFDRMGTAAHLVLFSNHTQHIILRVLSALRMEEDVFDFVLYADISHILPPIGGSSQTGTLVDNYPKLKPHTEAFARAVRVLGYTCSERVYYVGCNDASLSMARSMRWTVTKLIPVSTTGSAAPEPERVLLDEVNSMLEVEKLAAFADLFADANQATIYDFGRQLTAPLSLRSVTDSIQFHLDDFNDPPMTSASLLASDAGSKVAGAAPETLHSTSLLPQSSGRVKLLCRRDGVYIHGPSHVSEGDTYFEEDPSFYLRILKPYYSSLPQPNVLVRDYMGGSKFYNRCARRGFVGLFTADGLVSLDLKPTVTSAGGFLVMPNPGYHNRLTKAVKDCMRGLLSAAELEIIRAEEEIINSRDPGGSELDSNLSGGFIYTAWWVQSQDIPQIAAVLAELVNEGLRLAGAKPVEKSTNTSTSFPPLEPLLPPAVPSNATNMQRQTSAFPSVDGYRLAPSTSKYECGVRCALRHPGYVHSVRALTGTHIPLLQSVLKHVPLWLRTIHGDSDSAKVAEMGVHYPYVDHFSTLHIHIRTATYPNCDGGHNRGIFDLHDIVDMLTADALCMEKCIIGGVLTMLTIGWLDKLRKNCPSDDLAAAIQWVTSDKRVLRLSCDSSNSVVGPQLNIAEGNNFPIEALARQVSAELEDNLLSTTAGSSSCAHALPDVSCSNSGGNGSNGDETNRTAVGSFITECLRRRPDVHFSARPVSRVVINTEAAAATSAVDRLMCAVDDSFLPSFSSPSFSMQSSVSLSHLQSLRLISVVGPPAIGKNTTLQPLCYYRQWFHLSAGDLLRSILNEGQGNNLDAYTNQQFSSSVQNYRRVIIGLLYKVQYTTAKALKDRYWQRIDKYQGLLVVKYLSSCVPRGSTVVLDNYPRSLVDLEVLRSHGAHIAAYVHVDVVAQPVEAHDRAVEELARRMHARGRGTIDQQPTAARNRIKHYLKNVVPQISATLQALESPLPPTGHNLQQNPVCHCRHIELSCTEDVGAVIEQIMAAIAPVLVLDNNTTSLLAPTQLTAFPLPPAKKTQLRASSAFY